MHLEAKNELSGTFNNNHKVLKMQTSGDACDYMKVLLWQIIFGQPLRMVREAFFLRTLFQKPKGLNISKS